MPNDNTESERKRKLLIIEGKWLYVVFVSFSDRKNVIRNKFI